MIVQSIVEFAKASGFVQIVKTIRANTNGYPFLTFINKDNVAENIYFSKSAQVVVGAPVTAEMLKQFQIAQCINAQGEPRTKLVSNSERLDIADLLG